ncbi:MAG: choice-of-anchor tandem repeat GloVer-containing protein [Candidatus Korobacteraceae bacterium]|jgi:uncharacterized repeat protein (TIGR03803 family)
MKKIGLLKTTLIPFVFCAAVALNSPAQTVTVLHNFAGSDGANPAVGLVLATDGNLYGTASTGGNNGTNAGTAFKITTSGTLTTLYNFCQLQYCDDGAQPMQIIQGRDGNFYGVTISGANGETGGVIFKLTPSGSESVPAKFCNGTYGCGSGPQVGSHPTSLMQANDGNFYGVTSDAGLYSTGGLWQLVANGGGFTSLYIFSSTYGVNPSVTLVQGADGQLYGVAYYGGNGLPDCASSCGTVFKLTLSGNPTLLHSFCLQTNCTDGAEPTAALVRGSDGNFYGTTSAGGANYAGVIFKVTPNGTYTILHSFAAAGEGNSVVAPMIQGSDGNFYGTSNGGGAHGLGTIFEISPSGDFTTLYNFQGSDGANPQGGLVEVNGTFYGTTYAGGANNDGTVFKFQPVYYTLTVTTTGQGSVTSTDGFINCPGACSHSYVDNAQVTLNALPAAGWNLSTWGGACSGNGACTVTMSQAQTVSATFVQSTYTLTVSIAGNGSVTSTDGFINCPGTCSHSYLSFTPVTLNAAPQSGWAFAGWTGACSGVGACNLTMTGNLGLTAVFIEPGHGLEFSPATPCRLVDTRQTGGAIQGGSSRDFPIQQEGGCNIPATAAAYSLNVTVVPQGPLGYLTIWPTGEFRPVVSTLNSADGRVKANAAIVPAGTSGDVSVYVTNTSNVILDIDGYFAPVSGSTLAFYPLPPCRVADTRDSTKPTGLGPPQLFSQTPRAFPVLSSTCIPTGVNPAAYSFNFTVVPGGHSVGYLSVWPTGQNQPVVSTLNDQTGTIVANAAIVPAGTGGEVSVYATDNTQLVIDIDGYFAPAGQGGLSLYPVAPCRVIDTRHVGNGQPFTGTLTPPVDVEHSQCGPPAAAQAYVFNATVIPVSSLGYLTLWPDGGNRPTVSTLNASDGSITNNMAIVPTNNGKIDAYAGNGLTQLILDISSFFAP